MATKNKNRFIRLPEDVWLSAGSSFGEYYVEKSPLYTSPVELIAGSSYSTLVLNAVFNDNALAFLCDKDGKLILRNGYARSATINRPIVNVAPVEKDGIISSPARSTNIAITYKGTASSSEGSFIYDTKKVTEITENIKDFTWRNEGHGSLSLYCKTSGWENSTLSGIVSKIHDRLKNELSSADNYPVPDVLGITSEDNDARDMREPIWSRTISWPNEVDDVGDRELSYYRSIEPVFNISYSRDEEDKCTTFWVVKDDGTEDRVDKRTQEVTESLKSSETSRDQFGLVFPLLLGSSKIEITASISTSVTSETKGGRELKAEELANVPVYITWGKIGDKLTSENGCILDATMPDLGVDKIGATKGYPTFTGVGSKSDGLIQIMMDDESKHSKICEIPETHAMWFKLGFGIKELFNTLGNIVLLENAEKEPPDFEESGGSYIVAKRRTDASISVGVNIKVKVVE